MTHPTRAEFVEAIRNALTSIIGPPVVGDMRHHERVVERHERGISELAGAVADTLCTLIPGLPALMDGAAKVVPVKLLTEAHACMRATGWQLAPACDDGSDGVLNAAVAEIEDQFTDILAASHTP